MLMCGVTGVTETMKLGQSCKNFMMTHRIEVALYSGSFFAIPFKAPPEQATTGHILILSVMKKTFFCR